YLRIMNFKTRQKWVFQPDHADLDIIGDVEPPPDTVSADSAATTEPAHHHSQGSHQTLYIVSTQGQARAARKHGQSALYLPINSDALEIELNQLGTRIEQVKFPAVAAQSVDEAASVDSGLLLQHIKLKKWPGSQLLTNPERVKLA